jgi:dCMP deaminase
MNSAWISYFLDMAGFIAQKSKDPSTKCGCVIVYPDGGICSTGFNGFPRGVKDSMPFIERFERPLKYKFTEHSERNAIFNAAKHGHVTDGCTLFVTGLPCSDCTRAIIQAGIVEINADMSASWTEESYARWYDELTVAKQMCKEAGVTINRYRIPLGFNMGVLP